MIHDYMYNKYAFNLKSKVTSNVRFIQPISLSAFCNPENEQTNGGIYTLPFVKNV